MTRSADSTCSNLNLSLQAISGRQTQLIGGHDDENHDRETRHQGAHVAGVGGRLQIAAQAGQLEVARRPW